MFWESLLPSRVEFMRNTGNISNEVSCIPFGCCGFQVIVWNVPQERIYCFEITVNQDFSIMCLWELLIVICGISQVLIRELRHYPGY